METGSSQFIYLSSCLSNFQIEKGTSFSPSLRSVAWPAALRDVAATMEVSKSMGGDTLIICICWIDDID